jgi:hypothetical protein
MKIRRASALFAAAAFFVGMLAGWSMYATLLVLQKDPPLPETSADAEPLRWLDHADVIADFKKQVEQRHDARFVSQFALSAEGALGLDDTPEVRALVAKHGKRHLEGTTDVIFSGEQQRLLSKANIYVHQYNILLLLYLREHPDS